VIRKHYNSGRPQSRNRNPGAVVAMRFLGEPFNHDPFVSSGRGDFEAPVDG
jgi:hypothetical protein